MSAHLPVDELAAYAAGELDAVAAVPVEAHVLLCADCRADVEALRTTAAALAAVPPVTMPADVAARVSAALAAERPAPVTVLPVREKRTRLAGFAAAAAMVGLMSAVGIGLATRDRGGSRSTAGGLGEARERGNQVYSTDYNYSRTSLAGVVPGLLTGKPPSGTRVTAGSGAVPVPASSGETTTDSSAPQFTAGGGADPLARLRQEPGLTACLAELRAGGPAVAPLALDYARWQGQPALVVVLPRIVGSSPSPDRVDVWVVGPGCGPADAQVLDFQRVQVPPG